MKYFRALGKLGATIVILHTPSGHSYSGGWPRFLKLNGNLAKSISGFRYIQRESV